MNFFELSTIVALYLYLYLYLYLHLNLYLYLYLYLPKKVVEANKHMTYSHFDWQTINQIRPLSNVAGRISTALCYDLGEKCVRTGSPGIKKSARLDKEVIS